MNQQETPREPDPSAIAFSEKLPRWRRWWRQKTVYFLFEECLRDPEQERRARLIMGFGFLGFFSGMIYLSFYLVIHHFWGVGIIAVCSVLFAVAPFAMRARRSLVFAGNLLVGTMAAGFTALCGVEGGLSGHALAWLASVPLCALLLVGKDAAKYWLFLCFVSSGAMIALALGDVKVPVTFDKVWEPLVSAVGYLGLIVFMCILGLIFEISREQAQARMREALKKLEASNVQLVNLNNEKNEFLGIAAHDLKNPLTTIVLGADMIRMTNPAPHHQRAITGIIEASTRMRDLVSQLLDANAIEEGRYISRIERCDFAALAGGSVANNLPIAQKKGTELKAELPGELLVKADRNAVLRILDNLISNAVKYSPGGTTVEIQGFKDGEQAAIAVIDHGPGISEEDQKKMFGKFTRLSAKPTGGESSNGLGLSIVKRLAEAMEGRVKCESRLGEGATFTIFLPVWREG